MARKKQSATARLLSLVNWLRTHDEETLRPYEEDIEEVIELLQGIVARLDAICCHR